jgi:hypothetical protein
MDPMKVGDPYRLPCKHLGKIVWISKNGETVAVKAREGAGSCCNRKAPDGTWHPTVFLIKLRNEDPPAQANASHLTTLVHRFLATLQTMKSWNQLDRLHGAPQLKRHLANIIEYTFHIHNQHITHHGVERLIALLEHRRT